MGASPIVTASAEPGCNGFASRASHRKMRLRHLLITAVLAAGLGVAAGAIAIQHDGLAADRAPGRLETFVARRLVVLSIPASARAMTARATGAGSDEAARF